METIQQQDVGHEVSKRRDKAVVSSALRNKRPTNGTHRKRRHSVFGAQRKLTKPA